MGDRLIAQGLAGDAGAHPGQGVAPFLGDRFAAIVAFFGAVARRRQRAGAQDRILHRIVDLVLHRAIARPSAGHVSLQLPSCEARSAAAIQRLQRFSGLLRSARNDGYFFSGCGGATYGLNAPPGTAEATGLSKPSLLTAETPNTQSSTRMCGRIARQLDGFGRIFPAASLLGALSPTNTQLSEIILLSAH